MSRHILVIDGGDNPDERGYSIECPDGNGCSGWIECGEQHPADSNPWDCADDKPWAGQDEHEFHGVWHTWRSGHGWTVPYDRCIVQFADWEPPDDAHDKPAGRYEVDDDWDDTDVHLDWVDAVGRLGAGRETR